MCLYLFGFVFLICSTELDDSIYAQRPNIDHNHETGEIRGILCHKCNTGIGLLNDDQELLKKAITYLESTNENL